MLKVRVVLLLPEDGSIAVKAGYPPEDTLDDADLAAANWAWENDRPAGRGSDTLPGAKRLFLPMRTGRGAIGVVGIDSDKTGPAADAGPAPPARCADRSGRARDRARASGRGHGPGQAHGRDRSPALGAADLDLARSQDAARLGARRGQHAARPVDRAERCREGRSACDHHRRIRAAQPLHRQSARHDQARIRRHRAECRAARSRRDRRQRACGARARSSRSHQVSSSSSPPTCRCWSSMRCCSSRCCSTCSTMPRNMRRPARRSASGAGATRTSVCLQILDEGDGIPPGRSRAHLRQVLSRAKGRSCARRHRPRPRDLPRLRRGHARHDHGGQPHRPDRRGVHHQAADPGRRPSSWTPPHDRRPAQGSGHRRRAADPQTAADGAEHAGL